MKLGRFGMKIKGRLRMKILKNSIIYLASCGYRTTQIPQYDFDLSGNYSSAYEEIPDDWVMTIYGKTCSRLALGRERGFWHLSRKGFEANKELIQKAFEDSPMKRGTWEQFLEESEIFWEKIEKGTERYKSTLRKKLESIQG